MCDNMIAAALGRKKRKTRRSGGAVPCHEDGPVMRIERAHENCLEGPIWIENPLTPPGIAHVRAVALAAALVAALVILAASHPREPASRRGRQLLKGLAHAGDLLHHLMAAAVELLVHLWGERDLSLQHCLRLSRDAGGGGVCRGQQLLAPRWACGDKNQNLRHAKST
jgi:hypothetical protein